ncbi:MULTISPECIES: muconolactone Delta-isomerase family protein [unclassified Brevibacterium]|uniref:muconolactone Delta-isomerase family protein n=1 Tax=unclassified Brevibacterium TaxID=2614124 RepID=UPI0021532395|nr:MULTISPECIES: muconolactone Delta-isomerase family protein [unclassified Brevibacterium]
MDVEFPESMTDETKADFQVKEMAYSAELQERGIMKGIWRIVGEYSNISIYDVNDLDFLHATFQGFPMFAYMNVKVTPLAKHLNAITDDFFRQL